MRKQTVSTSKQNFIYSELLNRITSGGIACGGFLPTEGELAAEFNCSRGTVGRAIVRLVQEGLVECKQRIGSRVIRNSVAAPVAKLDLDACGFICPSEQYEGVWRSVLGFQQAAHKASRRTLTLSTGTDYQRETEIVGRLGDFNLKGALLFPMIASSVAMAFYSQMILTSPFPIVTLELAFPGMGRPSVVVDGLHAGYTMTKYLLEKGLRRIGFLAHYAWAPFVRDRYLGYRQALEEAGIEPGSVLLEQRMTPDFVNPTEESFQIAKGYLETSARDTEAVVCGSDFMAMGLIRAAEARGMEVPRDLKVTGIDDFAVAATACVPLTTYHIPYDKMGSVGFDMLNRLMAGETALPTEVQIRGELVARQSA